MQTQFTVQDLHPATWYVMIVTAHSDAGSTDSELKFATLTYTGSEYREDREDIGKVAYHTYGSPTREVSIGKVAYHTPSPTREVSTGKMAYHTPSPTREVSIGKIGKI